MRLHQAPCYMVLLIFSFALAGQPAYAGHSKKKHKAKKEAKEGKKKEAGEKPAVDEKKIKEEAGDKEAAGSADSKKGSEILEKALTLYSEGKYDEAAELFKQANELMPSPSAYYNIARCYEKSYKYTEAYDYYKKYVETGDKIKLEGAQEALKRIEEMSLLLKVISKPDGADVLVDGKPVEAQKTPLVFETVAGKHSVLVKKKGYLDKEEEVEIPYGGEGRVEVYLEAAPKVVEKPDKDKSIEPIEGGKTPGKQVPFSLRVAAGATVSTAKVVGSYIDASLVLAFRIKGGRIGIGLDNMFFSDSYLLAAYPVGGYGVKVWKHLTLEFNAGFGAAYLNSFSDGGDGEGNVTVEKGSHWDLVVHADFRLCFHAGPVLVLLVPVHANVLIGVGSIDPAPLAQLAFLVGVGYDL